MPKIAEIREIEGALWCKLEPFPMEHGSVSIYTEHEVAQLKRSVAYNIAEEALNMYPKPSI